MAATQAVLRTADGLPLKVKLRRSARRSRLTAVGFVLPLFAFTLFTFLIPIGSLLYRSVNRVRRALYRAGILKAKRLPVRVISVGGIAAGGSGKTPATIAIAGALAARGLRVGVLTRGYGRAGVGGVIKELDPDRYVGALRGRHARQVSNHEASSANCGSPVSEYHPSPRPVLAASTSIP